MSLVNINYLYIVITIVLTVYGQLIIKWQVIKAGSFPELLSDRFFFLFNLLLNPWVISALIAAFCAALSWMVAMTKFELSHAYPFMGLTFLLILVLSAIVFNEPLSFYKIAGTVLIITGIFIGSR